MVKSVYYNRTFRKLLKIFEPVIKILKNICFTMANENSTHCNQKLKSAYTYVSQSVFSILTLCEINKRDVFVCKGYIILKRNWLSSKGCINKLHQPILVKGYAINSCHWKMKDYLPFVSKSDVIKHVIFWNAVKQT